ncbi:hypothetical protein C7S18_00595 [Ahniella affigens]|uniref:Endonuclease/exonuclease/phosphatase domain-containing protein n=1 Tax=Ahniella affigens TaxID=2021234 RepID=A0A2P1PLR8_9GAMM|nr:endonuclease/exonuclease/phosphatase family protein [Ahniella affigens]AVP95785.1 hypothetical protein C7S18_00595 [Ahniella affigens]
MNSASGATTRAFRISGILDACLLLLTLGIISPWLARAFDALTWVRLAWLSDLASHWQWLWASLLVTIVLIRVWQRAHLRLGLLGLLLLPCWSAAPRLPIADGPSNPPTLRIAAVNLLVTNHDAIGLRAFLDQVKPDIVVLTELHPDIARTAGTWGDYPERFMLAEDSPFGIGVLSRVPWQDAESQIDATGLPEIDVRLVWQGKPVLLSAVHPMPPMSAAWHQARAEKLQAVAKRQQTFPGARLIVGDLNASPWSSALRPLNATYQRANALQATWPSNALGWLGIPIDLILASPDWAVQQFQVAPAFGSDHHPVWADLVLIDQDAKQESP